MPELTYQIQSSLADARETDSGSVAYHFSDIHFGFGLRYQFFRFISVNIPQGATISSASLKVIGYSPAYSYGAVTANLYAEKSADPPVLNGTTASGISDRPLTTNTVAWVLPAFVANTEYESGDISAIIQEIVNQSKWARNNPINIISDVGAGTTGFTSRRFWAWDGDASKSAILKINFKTPSGSATEITQPKIKQFWHKVYDPDGTYNTTWAKEVYNTPQFVWNVNGGMGEMVIDLKRPASGYGENDDVKMGNRIETWVQDGDQEIGRRVWQGVLNRYEPTVLSDGTEGTRVRAVSKLIEMQNRIVRDGADNTTVAKNSKDPSTMLTEIIDSASADSTLQKGDIELTGETVSYEFNANTFVEAFNIITKLAPQYWYWRLMPDNTVDFKVANYDEVQHQFYVGKHVNNVRMTKSIENLVNRIYFMGGGDPNLFKTYERTSSQNEFGLREQFIKDERVTVDATAETISTRLLDELDHPISEIEFEILDNNIDPVNGYDIESLKVGQIIQIMHPETEYGFTEWDEATWDVDYWDYDISKAFGNPHQIVQINYEFNKCIIKASAKFADIQQRIEDIMRNLETTAKVNLPSAPS